MTPSTQPTSGTDKRVQRAERILDAAGELLVSWGYPKITVEDVARRAGIGKGTVYLHFPTKEVLFLVAVLRARKAMMDRILEEARRSPDGIWPSSLARTVTLESHDSPIIAALMTGRTETLGTLSRIAAENSAELLTRGRIGFEAYFDLLRDRGLIRTDRSRDDQVYAYSAVLTGFLVREPLLAEQHGLTRPHTGDHADIVADTIRSALGESDADGALRTVWPEVVGLFEALSRETRAEVERHTHATRDT